METINTKKKCPKCNKSYLEQRTPRGFLVKKLLFWLPIRRYKCGGCQRKTYVYGASTGTSGSSPLQVVKPVN